ncbi:NAD(P)-dependent oxidoreductase [Flavisphingomonas formosensis]|uniref:NAD(P)-dependent oxidoreductase n=1 Tax=Flavisphingomonas formosensis TaxID=861534 RepID=UPI0012FA9220|nr:NAD(P)-dependent oxidoreductase [Sphingomonas formosensis]
MTASPAPRVIMLHEGLSKPLAAMADGAFVIVGPWMADQGWDAWLDAGNGRGIRAAITAGADPFDRTLLDRLPDLEEIIVFGAGHEGVDTAHATARGIRINAAGATHAGDVADHAVGLILAARRRLLEGDRWVREGRWMESRIAPSRSMKGARVGIVGLGNIGRAIAERLDAFGCDTRWWGRGDKPGVPWPRVESLEQLAAESEVLAVAIYAHDSTRGLISRAVIEALGPDGCLVNVARGFVIDEEAMIAALKDGRLGQAALDVFAHEPEDGSRWRDVPNTILTPHSAGDTRESFLALCRRAVEAAKAVTIGQAA